MKRKNIRYCLVIQFFITLTFIVSNAYSETLVPEGNVSGNWDAANSPYIIQGDIAIPGGSELIIEAGTVIEFEPGYKLDVTGTLTAIGTEVDNIFFTSSQSSPNPGDWDGIHFYSGSSSSELSQCVIEFGIIGLEIIAVDISVQGCEIRNNSSHGVSVTATATSSTPEYGYGADPEIDNCIIENNGGYGVHYKADGKGLGDYPYYTANIATVSGKLTNSIIRNNVNSGVGIYAYYDDSILYGVPNYGVASPVIQLNTIYNNGEDGIKLGDNWKVSAGIFENQIYQNNHSGINCTSISGKAEIVGNIISNNTENGIINENNNTIIEGNTIIGNLICGIETTRLRSLKENIIKENTNYDLYYTGALDQLAPDNDWGTTDANTINSHIYDILDDSTIGEIIWYDPDEDNDAMPVWFENQYNLNPNDPSDAFENPDGDYLNNREEYWVGSDPFDANSPNIVYVDAVNSGVENGSESNPWNTIQEGIDNAVSPSMIKVAAGIYEESIVLKDGVWIEGEGAGSTTIRGAVKSEGSNHFGIKNFKIESRIYIADNSGFSNSAVLRNIIVGSTYYGIELSNSNTVIQNNLLYNQSSYSLYSEIGSGVIENNTFIKKARFLDSEHTLINNIFNGVFSQDSDSELNMHYNNIVDYAGSGNIIGTNGNIQEDPVFIDPFLKNYITAPTSPSRDAGDPALKYNDPDDTRNDQGAYGGLEALDGLITDTTRLKLLLNNQIPISVSSLFGRDSDFQWESSDESVATVTGSGSTAIIIGIQTGEAVITVTGVTSGSKVSFMVYVYRLYFVNDGLTGYDEWCTNVGSDSNDGLSPSTPKATIQAILDSYELVPGDVVHIDTGTYYLTTNIEITSSDQGAEVAPVTFEASPYGVIINHDGTSNSTVFQLNNADYITIRTATSEKYPGIAQHYMKLTDANYGIYLSDADNCIISRIELFANSYSGIYSDDSENTTYYYNLIYNNENYGIYLSGNSDNSEIVNNTILKNSDGQISFSSDNVTLKNNIIWAEGIDNYCIRSTYGTVKYSDYNLIYATNGAYISSYNYNFQVSLAEWQDITGDDLNSISFNPQFDDPDNGDFHLKSTGGSYHNGEWSVDTESSPGIDTGDPSSDFNNEPVNNGELVNMGAYGGTEQASKSPLNRKLIIPILYGGEVVKGSYEITWWIKGQAWQTGDTVTIEYSSDNGITWNIINGQVLAENGYYLWDTTSPSIPDRPYYRIRITSNEDGNSNTISGWFIVHNGPIQYYVNDASTDLDNWCTEIGDELNDGITPETPKASVQAVLNTFDIEPGDTIYIDTGIYSLTSELRITEYDEGSEGVPVTLEFSPYGVEFSLQTGSGIYTVFTLSNSKHIVIKTGYSSKYPEVSRSLLKIIGFRDGIAMGGADYSIIDGVEVTSCYNTGIYASSSENVTLSNNIIYGNGQGIVTGPSNIVLNNIVFENDEDGIIARAASLIKNNTVVKNYDSEITIAGENVILKNNILWADGSNNDAIVQYPGTIGSSDYNLIYATNGAYIIHSEGGIRNTFIEWQTVSGFDLNSLSLNPGFFDIENGDFHLKSAGGRYYNGEWVIDAESSPGIDTGDPLSIYSNEPDNNGERINLGAYGGTGQASKSSSGRSLVLPVLNGGEILKGEFEIKWISIGQEWLPGDTLKIEYSNDNGTSWNLITESVSAEDGYYLWNTSGFPNSTYLIRIVCNEDTDVLTESETWFYVHNGPIHYYVNDNSIALDEWCTGVGDDSNAGVSPSVPKATIQGIIDAYHLMEGDIVHIDTGTYSFTEDIEITDSDQGVENAPVVFEASPYGVLLDRNYDYTNHTDQYVFYLYRSDYITIRTATSDRYPGMKQSFMKITNGSYGIYLSSADNCIINRVDLSSNSVGFYSKDSSDFYFYHNLVYDNVYDGIHVSHGYDNKVINNTILKNCANQAGYSSQVYATSSDFTFKNNIVWADGSGNFVIGTDSQNFGVSDYNLFYTSNGGRIGDRGYYSDLYTLEDWQTATGNDLNSFSLEPKFVDSGNDDYHLKSTGGSYHGGLWDPDGETSPGIDAGNPLDEYDSEPDYNGVRVNLGTYGGTEQASKSPSGREIFFKTLYEGKTLHDSYMITWLYTGQEWQFGDTLKIEYSVDNGATWNLITASVLVQNNNFLWDTTLVPSSPYYQIRLTSNADAESYVVNDGWFYVHNWPIHYYVNDFSTNLDEWCTNAGNDNNDGLTPATPKATVQSVVDTFELQEGDIVHIDTGTYYLANNILITENDQGTEIAPVYFEASPYGVIINRNATQNNHSAFRVYESSFITIRTSTSIKYPNEPQYFMKLIGGYYGIYLDDSDYCTLSRLEISSNSGAGIRASNSSYAIYSNNLIYDNSGTGITVGPYSSHNMILNNTVVKNGSHQIAASGNYVELRNNIIWVDGVLYGFDWHSDNGFSDYNLIYTTNEAYTGYYYDDGSYIRTTLGDWQSATGMDSNSISLDPKFVNPENGDYHLKSTGGSYHNGTWTADAENSPGIDAGDPMDDFSSEPSWWHGHRINLGAYGGTEQASKTVPGDIDGDGLSDDLEDNGCTDLYDSDTDNDGIPDGVEDANHDGIINSGETDPCDSDSDNDGLNDGEEDANHNGLVDPGETNPLDVDTDDDGMPDGWEVQNDLDPLDDADADEDPDGDGYSNLKEYQRKTDPNDYNSQPSKGLPWLMLLLGDD